MGTTYTCLLDGDEARFSMSSPDQAETVLPRQAFDRIINRRQRGKLSTATQLAAALFEHFKLNDRLRGMGCDPSHTPLIVCNRYASWDYIARTTCADVEMAIDGINNYMATAWFPAAVQGYLTIEYGNTAQAITLATTDPDLQAATIDALFARDANGQRAGAVIFGTFECLPDTIGGCAVVGARGAAFGAVSLITPDMDHAAIQNAVATHQNMYPWALATHTPSDARLAVPCG